MSIYALSPLIALAGAPAVPDATPLLAVEPLFAMVAVANALPSPVPHIAADPVALMALPETTPKFAPPSGIAPRIETEAVATVHLAAAAADFGAGEVVHDIVVTSKPRPTKADPMAPLNAEIFGATMAVDAAITGPLAMTYRRAVPHVVRSGIRNFLDNLDEPIVLLNYLLQFKPGKSLETLGRFGLNSTLGIGGLIDVAKTRPFKLPRRPNGFGNTLGYYGVKPGAYLYLPLIGPTTVRDLVGGALDMRILPTLVGAPFNKMAFTLPTGLIDAVDSRSRFEDQLQKLREQPTDLYRARRAFYLKKRQDEIDCLHGRIHGPVCGDAPEERPAGIQK